MTVMDLYPDLEIESAASVINGRTLSSFRTYSQFQFVEYIYSFELYNIVQKID